MLRKQYPPPASNTGGLGVESSNLSAPTNKIKPLEKRKSGSEVARLCGGSTEPKNFLVIR